MITRLVNRFKKPAPISKPIVKEKPKSIFSTDDYFHTDRGHQLQEAWDRNFQKGETVFKSTPKNMAMDNQLNIKGSFQNNYIVPESLVLWYAGQSFIGYQLAAMIAQNWLVSKCCLMPAKDATRNGYEITVNDGTDVDPEILDAIRKLDVEYRLNYNLIQLIQMGRIFGIRHAMFIVDSEDPDYYKKPFNPDGVTAGSYKGISQIDPYWMTPQLDTQAAGDPAGIHFYEPTWWVINGVWVHRTHIIIFRTEEVADILKPTYIYGGIPIPQKIYERVYAAERTANEAPMLALTKRTDVLKVDTTQAAAQEGGFMAGYPEMGI